MTRIFHRSTATLAIALVGALALVAWASTADATHFAGAAYLQAWAGACFKVATGACGGYWISRHLLRIDVSQVAGRFIPGSREQSLAAASAQLARALIVAACIVAVCLAP